MSFKRGILIFFLFFCLIASLLFLGAAVFPDHTIWKSLPELPGLFRESTTASSWSVLETIDNLEDLETAQYEMKFVFPFDFVTSPAVNWLFLKTQYDISREQFQEHVFPLGQRHSRPVAPVWQDAALYELCRKVGMDPGKPDYKFLIISAHVRAGLDLTEWHREIERQQATITETTPDELVLNLPHPVVRITSFSINDTDNTAQGFPDVSLSPEEWSTLIQEVEPLIREQALAEGLLQQARTEAEQLIREIFLASGFRQVLFVPASTTETP